MPSPTPIDFSSAIDNARLAAARDEALRRYAEHSAAVQLKSSRWSALPGRSRAPARAPAAGVKPAASRPTTHAR